MADCTENWNRAWQQNCANNRVDPSGQQQRERHTPAEKIVGDEGLEETSDSPTNSHSPREVYAPDYAHGTDSQVIDQSLADVIAGWRWMPDDAKAEVSRLVRAAQVEGRQA